MSYATAAQMLEWYGAKELVDTATPDDVMLIAPQLLRLTVEEGNRGSYEEAEVAAADLVLERLQGALEDASILMDAYLMRRYTVPFPAAEQTPLPRICGSIARFLLQDERATPEVKAAYERSLTWLGMVNEGKFMLSKDSGPQYENGQRPFAPESFKNF
ncbi:MAG: DUF1320 family protein [Magnetococcales bacterium]|nr:DUF1320 family protein [Magnetococcales bacterium]NGZ26101.1 DUF1320 family protein [Magnetococcales bacterium]